MFDFKLHYFEKTKGVSVIIMSRHGMWPNIWANHIQPNFIKFVETPRSVLSFDCCCKNKKSQNLEVAICSEFTPVLKIGCCLSLATDSALILGNIIAEITRNLDILTDRPSVGRVLGMLSQQLGILRNLEGGCYRFRFLLKWCLRLGVHWWMYASFGAKKSLWNSKIVQM